MIRNIPPRPAMTDATRSVGAWIPYISALESQAEPRIVDMTDNYIAELWQRLFVHVQRWVRSGYAYTLPQPGSLSFPTSKVTQLRAKIAQGFNDFLDEVQPYPTNPTEAHPVHFRNTVGMVPHVVNVYNDCKEDKMWTVYACDNVLRRGFLTNEWPHILDERHRLKRLRDGKTVSADERKMRELWCISIVYRVFHDEIFEAMRQLVDIRLPDPRETWMYKLQKWKAWSEWTHPVETRRQAWEQETWRDRRFKIIEERVANNARLVGRRGNPERDTSEVSNYLSAYYHTRKFEDDKTALQMMRTDGKKKRKLAFMRNAEDHPWSHPLRHAPRDQRKIAREHNMDLVDSLSLNQARAKLFIALWSQVDDCGSGGLYEQRQEWQERVVNVIFDCLEPLRQRRVDPEHEACSLDGSRCCRDHGSLGHCQNRLPNVNHRVPIDRTKSMTDDYLKNPHYVGRRALKGGLYALVKEGFKLSWTMRTQPRTIFTNMIRPMGEYEFDVACMEHALSTPTSDEIANDLLRPADKDKNDLGGFLTQAHAIQAPAHFSTFGKVILSVTPSLCVRPVVPTPGAGTMDPKTGAPIPPAPPIVLSRALVIADLNVTDGLEGHFASLRETPRSANIRAETAIRHMRWLRDARRLNKPYMGVTREELEHRMWNDAKMIHIRERQIMDAGDGPGQVIADIDDLLGGQKPHWGGQIDPRDIGLWQLPQEQLIGKKYELPPAPPENGMGVPHNARERVDANIDPALLGLPTPAEVIAAAEAARKEYLRSALEVERRERELGEKSEAEKAWEEFNEKKRKGVKTPQAKPPQETGVGGGRAGAGKSGDGLGVVGGTLAKKIGTVGAATGAGVQKPQVKGKGPPPAVGHRKKSVLLCKKK